MKYAFRTAMILVVVFGTITLIGIVYNTMVGCDKAKVDLEASQDRLKDEKAKLADLEITRAAVEKKRVGYSTVFHTMIQPGVNVYRFECDGQEYLVCDKGGIIRLGK